MLQIRERVLSETTLDISRNQHRAVCCTLPCSHRSTATRGTYNVRIVRHLDPIRRCGCSVDLARGQQFFQQRHIAVVCSQHPLLLHRQRTVKLVRGTRHVRQTLALDRKFTERVLGAGTVIVSSTVDIQPSSMQLPTMTRRPAPSKHTRSMRCRSWC